MIDTWIVLSAAFLYLFLLFVIAYLGDRKVPALGPEGRPIIYSLSLAVYCTSWTFFGSVGLSAKEGYSFIPVYLGAILMIIFGQPLLQHIIKLSKKQNINSIADFISARYGKNQFLAAIVTVIAVIGTLPYIALQLQAVSESVTTVLGNSQFDSTGKFYIESLGKVDIAFVIAVLMAVFSTLFGTKKVAATEHHEGLILAVAVESVIKLFAFLTVGIYITFFMFGGPFELWAQASNHQHIRQLFTQGVDGSTWFTITFLSMLGIILLPRQFHVAVVENKSPKELRKAAWLFPLYLIAINIFVIPIAIAGLLTFPSGGPKPDMFVLALPMQQNADWITMIAFIGGLSSATAMVIVASVALSIMIANDLIVPILLRGQKTGNLDNEDLSDVLLNIRRTAVFVIFILAYIFYHMISGNFPLAEIGLLSFAAIAQFAPAFIGGLLWRRATARGAIAGITAGFIVWAYTLLLPAIKQTGLIPEDIFVNGLLGLDWLRPEKLLYVKFDGLTHGVVMSLTANIIAYIVFSIIRQPKTIERLQANSFIGDVTSISYSPIMRFSRSTVTVEELKLTAARYLGEERAKRSFSEYANTRNINLASETEADIGLMRYTEHLLASAIGSASSRLVLSLMLKGTNVSGKAAIRLLDDATEAIQYNRDFLQSAIDQVSQGISVFDKNMRLICWNRQFRNLLDLPPELGRVGVGLDEIIRYNAEQGKLGAGSVDEIVKDRIDKMAVHQESYQERLNGGERILQLRTNTMPQGGIVTSYADITARIEAVEALARANENLEKRVTERTKELTQVNRELEAARAKADGANREKTRFLASASHDLLQPLNAARLYSSALVERAHNDEALGSLVQNVDASLGAVEEILNALLDISRLDSGVMTPEFKVFRLSSLLEQLEVEFQPLAIEKGLELIFVNSELYVKSDRKLLRRVLQNLISNAIKYTKEGSVLVGCRRSGKKLIVQVHDTGPGIPVSQQANIFKEFARLDSTALDTKGVGLGLSVVQRIANVLGHRVNVNSTVSKGSVFSLSLPIAERNETPRPQNRSETFVTSQHISGIHIICIDNEKDILEGMELLLSGWGCKILTAKNIAEAEAKAKRSTEIGGLDIILADYHLGDEIGLNAVRKIREDMGRNVPAIIITADHSAEVTEEVQKHNIQILRKPIKPAQLRALIAQLLMQERAAE